MLSKIASPVRVHHNLSETRVIDVTCGSFNTLCLTEDGTVYSWGANSWGECGVNADQTQSGDIIYEPARIGLGRTVCKMSAGKSHSALVDNDGRLFVFGNNEFG